MPAKFSIPDENNLIQRYLSGESVKDLCRMVGCSSIVIYRILREHGITRSGKEAARVRWDRPGEREKISISNRRVWAQRSPKERAHQVLAAHASNRGRKTLPHQLEARAQRRYERGKHRHESELERLFEAMLNERGLRFDARQWPVGPYNTDFAIDSVAVEVCGHGHDARYWNTFGDRARHFFDAGWSMLFFYFTTRKWILSPEVADYAISLINEFRGNPPAICEYRVIWGTGQFVTRRRADDADLSFVSAVTHRRDPTSGRYESIPRKA